MVCLRACGWTSGDIVFAKGQTTRVCYGCDWIEIEHDAPHQHTMHPFRDGSAPQGCVRWVMSHMTPVQTQIRLRAGRD